MLLKKMEGYWGAIRRVRYHFGEETMNYNTKTIDVGVSLNVGTKPFPWFWEPP